MRFIVFSALGVLMIHSGLNAQDVTYQKVPAQISLLYPVGTSGYKSAGQNIAFSFNLLAGVTGQVNGFEMAGLGNSSKSAVNGLQVAGLWNTGKENFTGPRIAGLLNIANNNGNGFLFYSPFSRPLFRLS